MCGSTITLLLRTALVCCAIIFFAMPLCGQEPGFLSHPPLRRNPEPSTRPMTEGPATFVDASKGDDTNAGSESAPWKSVSYAVSQLHAGDTLYLRGGRYFENVYASLEGTADERITIRSYPGEQAVIDGGLQDFQESAESAWEQIADDEYRSTRAYPNIRDVVGAFGDSDVGLQTYWHLIDLRSPHELSAPGENGDVRPQYCGPGLYYDRKTGHIHVRLAHTHFRNFDNYEGVTDPRKLPLVIAPFRSTPLWVDQCRHVKFQDLIIRGGGYETTKVTYGVDVEFDNVTIRGGTYCMRTENTGPFRFHRSAMYGNAPPWSFRGDGSLRARPGRPTRDIARLTCHALWVTDTGREFSVYAFPMNDNWEVSYSEFTDSHDGPYLGGINLKFHHNLVDFFQDDGIYLSQMYPRHLFMGEGARIEIYENLFQRALTPIAFGGMEDTRDDIYIYRNIFDLRGGVNYGRPSEKNPDIQPAPATRVMSDHGSPPWPKMSIYHNTFLLQSARRTGAGTLGHLGEEHPRAVFNNIYYIFKGIGAWQPPAPATGQSDGNMLWSPANGASRANVFDRFRKSAAFVESQSVYKPGFTANSIVSDPRFKNVTPDWPAEVDLRLLTDSPAINAGVSIPADWPDSRQKTDQRRPDIGALPAGTGPFEFGRLRPHK